MLPRGHGKISSTSSESLPRLRWTSCAGKPAPYRPCFPLAALHAPRVACLLPFPPPPSPQQPRPPGGDLPPFRHNRGARAQGGLPRMEDRIPSGAQSRRRCGPCGAVSLRSCSRPPACPGTGRSAAFNGLQPNASGLPLLALDFCRRSSPRPRSSSRNSRTCSRAQRWSQRIGCAAGRGREVGEGIRGGP